MILLYEWFITASDEIDLFWKKKKTVATYLFLFNRYVPPVYVISGLIYAPFTHDDTV